VLTFWVEGSVENKAVKLELEDTLSGILVKATAAKFSSGSAGSGTDWDTSGTLGTVATSLTASGYGVSLLQANGANLTSAMRAEGAIAARDLVAFDLVTGVQSLLSHSAAASNLESQAGDVRNATLSADGRYVLFTAADATKFGNGGTAFIDTAPAVTDLFATDVQTGQIRLLSRSGGGATASAGVAPTLLGTTAEGWAVFSVNNASALGFTDSATSMSDLFAFNLADGTLKLISRASSGSAISSAGVAVTFERIVGNHVYFTANNATSLGFTSDADNARADLFRFAPTTGAMELLSHSTTSATAAFAGNYRAGSLTVSPNGRYVAFAMNMQGSSGGFTVNVNGDALFLADSQTGAIRIVNSNDSEGTTLSYAAWAGVQDFERFFTPDGRLFVWGSSYGGYLESDRTGADGGWDNQFGRNAYMVDLSNGVSNAGIAQLNQLLNRSPAGPTVAAAADVALVGVSPDSRLAFFTAADATKFGNGGVAFADSGPTATDVFAFDLTTRSIVLVSGANGVSFGQSATFLGVSEGGTVLVSLGNVAGLGSIAGTLTDPNTSGTDVLALRLNLLDLINADDSTEIGTATDNYTKKDSFTLTSLGMPGRSLQLLDNGVLVATQTSGASGIVTWALTNVDNGVHTYTLRDTAEQVPFRLANALGSPSLVVTVDVSNRAPTNIGLSRSLIAENAGANAVVGSLSTTDPDAGNTFTYALVSGEGDSGNSAFNIVGNQLRANASLSLAAQSSHSVRIRTTDQDGLSYEESFTLTVTVANRTPTDIALSASSLAENAGANAVVGTLSSTDPDEANEFTYSLVAGSGDTDNALFNVAANQLRATASLDFETKSSYSVRVRTTDQGGLAFDKTFTITATNVNEPPTNVLLSNSSVAENAGANAVVGTLSSVDPDAGDTFTYTLVAGTGAADNASFNISGSQVRATANLDFETKSSYSIRVRASDAVGLTFDKALTINATNANESPTNVALSKSTIMEQSGANAVVGVLSTTDPDAGDTFTYTLVVGTGSTDNNSFNISGGQLRANASFSLATQSSYSVRVRTTDQGGLAFEKAFTITVTPANLAPTDIALSGTTIAENAGVNAVVGSLSTMDPDSGNTFTYSLVAGSGDIDNSWFNISGTQFRATASLDFETKSIYAVRVRTTDQGGLTFEKAFTIAATNVNEAPTDIALSKTTIVENAGANAVVGTLSATDPDAGNTITYSLVAGTGSTDNAAFNISGVELRATSSLNAATKSSYSVRVRATDQGGLSFEKEFTITVTPANRAPTDLVLSAKTVSENNAANAVVGELSSVDPDAERTFNYSLVSGPGSADNAAFNIAGSRLRATSVFDFETKRSYAIRLRTTGQDGLFFEKSFTISVTNVNEAPTDVALAPNAIAENAGANGVVGTLTTIDPDAANSFTFFAYTLVSGSGDTDNGSFNIQGNRLRATTSLDFETKSSYSIRVRAEDQGGLTVDKTLTVSVTNVNEAPTNLALSNSTIPENAGTNALVGNFTAIDPDAGSQFTYRLVIGEGSADNALFRLNGNQLRAMGSLNFETRSSYSIRVAAADLGGLSFAKSFIVTATNVNERPTNLTLSKLSIVENAGVNAVVGQIATSDPDAGDTFIYTLVAGTGDTDNAAFNIDGNQLRASASLDFETKSSYSVRLRSTDAGGLFAEKSFKISVTNANDAPTNIALSSTTIAENVGVNGVVGTLTATDQDKSSKFTFTLVPGAGDTDNGAFNISNNVLRASQSLNFETKSSYSVRVRVTDQAGGQFEKEFAIGVRDVNETPTAIALSNSTIAENAGANAVVGTLSATDPDVGGSFTYALVRGTGDTGNSAFNISGNQLRATKSLNAATRSSYSVRVQVTDQGGLRFVRTFTITVTAAAGPGMAGGSDSGEGEGESSWTAIESVRACDAIFADWKE
jgi:mRNA-degrading endonuclease HigB of HigAB toxin-antitoxin module